MRAPENRARQVKALQVGCLAMFQWRRVGWSESGVTGTSPTTSSPPECASRSSVYLCRASGTQSFSTLPTVPQGGSRRSRAALLHSGLILLARLWRSKLRLCTFPLSHPAFELPKCPITGLQQMPGNNRELCCAIVVDYPGPWYRLLGIAHPQMLLKALLEDACPLTTFSEQASLRS